MEIVSSSVTLTGDELTALLPENFPTKLVDPHRAVEKARVVANDRDAWIEETVAHLRGNISTDTYPEELYTHASQQLRADFHQLHYGQVVQSIMHEGRMLATQTQETAMHLGYRMLATHFLRHQLQEGFADWYEKEGLLSHPLTRTHLDTFNHPSAGDCFEGNDAIHGFRIGASPVDHIIDDYFSSVVTFPPDFFFRLKQVQGLKTAHHNTLYDILTPPHVAVTQAQIKEVFEKEQHTHVKMGMDDLASNAPASRNQTNRPVYVAPNLTR